MLIKKEAKLYIENHPEVVDEFFDLINSDPCFNYSKYEIADWIADCVLLR